MDMSKFEPVTLTEDYMANDYRPDGDVDDYDNDDDDDDEIY